MARSLQHIIPGTYFVFLIIYAIIRADGTFSPGLGHYFDAEHYLSIARVGYQDFQLAFFPLFPLFIRWLNLNVEGIVILNSVMFIVSFHWLSKEFQVSSRHRILFVAIPSVLFMFLPYTEAMFFVVSTWFIISYHKDKLIQAAVALIVCGLIRPTATIMIPAILLTELIRTGAVSRRVTRSAILILSSLAGLLITLVIQYAMTGKWLYFFEAQKLWGNELRLPKIPFSSWAGRPVVLLDAATGWFALVAGMFVVWMIISRLKNSEDKFSHSVVFSLAYLGGTFLMVVLFRGGEMFSLNRFVFATPFALVGVNWLLKKEVSRSWYLILPMVSMVFFLLFGSYVHIQNVLFYLALSLGLTMFLLIGDDNQRVSRVSFAVLIVGMILIQLYFVERIISGQWIG